MPDTDILTPAQRGGAKMDEVKPDWRQTTSPDRLDMHSITDCVLGQNFGTYKAGMFALFTAEEIGETGLTRLAYQYGFDIPGGYDDYEFLTDDWLAILDRDA